jgi:NADPH:quinone reductase-like Zn-dependent oxidoreductase
MTERAMGTVFNLVQTHAMKPVIDKKFSLDDVSEANRHLAENRPFGKVVVALE